MTYPMDSLHALDGYALIEQLDTLPVRSIARPMTAAEASASNRRLLWLLSRQPVVPLLDDAQRLACLIEPGVFLLNPQDGHTFLHPENTPASLQEHDTLETARICFARSNLPFIPILSASGTYTGQCASRKALIQLLEEKVEPPRIAGMATPMGVYMAYGLIRAGAKLGPFPHGGLYLTGVIFALLLWVLEKAYVVVLSGLQALYPPWMGISPAYQILGEYMFILGTILILMRLTPISGLHAAEHMTINAIETAQPVTAEVVRVQNRVHRRCGTNLMALLGSIQLGWLSLEGLSPHLTTEGIIIYILLWTLGISLSWKALGRWLQQHFTTKSPTHPQLISGLEAGRQIRAKIYQRPSYKPHWLHRLWGSGLIQILMAYLVTMGLLSLIPFGF